MHRPEVYSLRNNLQVDTPVQTPLSPKVYFMNALTVLQIKPPHLSSSHSTNLPPALLPVFFKLGTKARSLYVLGAKHPALKPHIKPAPDF